MNQMDSTEFVKSGLHKLEKEELNYLDRWVHKYVNNIEEDYSNYIKEIKARGKTQYEQLYKSLADRNQILQIEHIEASKQVIVIKEIDGWWLGPRKWETTSSFTWPEWEEGDKVIMILGKVIVNLDSGDKKIVEPWIKKKKKQIKIKEDK